MSAAVKHEAQVKYSLSDGYRRAVCSCGHRGPARASRGIAAQDVAAHLLSTVEEQA